MIFIEDLDLETHEFELEQDPLATPDGTGEAYESRASKRRVDKVLTNTRWVKRFIVGLLLMMLITLISGLTYIGLTLSHVPTVDVSTFKTESNSNMYDKDGNLIWSDTERRRDYISINDVPEDYKNFLLSTEDADFYEHPGYSLKGIANAAYSVFKEKILKQGTSRGGSTIEQQLIKNHVFSQNVKDRTIDRKIKEIWLASQLDLNYSKDQILEWYVNAIELGERSFGINTISLTYFGKPISELNSGSDEDLSKLAIIAGLGQAPSTYNLYDNPEAVKNRRYEVLLSAYNHGKITKEQMDHINEIDVQQDLQERFWRDKEVLQTMTKYSAHITSALKQVEELGYDLGKTPLQIYTTLDREATDKLQEIVDNVPGLRTDEQQMAATVIDNSTGHVIAQVGGRYQTEPMSLNRAIQRNRSTGSSIKPILDYAPAFEYLGYSTSRQISGSAYTYPGTNFTAYNYGGVVYGNVDLQWALRNSLNTPANRLLDEHIGQKRAKQFMSKLSDLDHKETYAGTDALGLDVSTADLATGFEAFANMGQYKKAQYVTKLGFADGSEKEITFEPVQAMMPSTAYIIIKILEGVPKFSAIGAEMPELSVAMKTGTVGYSGGNWPLHAASDIWIAATTKSVTTAVWSGYDVPQEEFVYDNTQTRNSVVKSIIRTFSAGKDNSEWQNPGDVLVNGSGLNAHYTPTKTYTEPDYSLAPIQYNTEDLSPIVKPMIEDSQLRVKPEEEVKISDLENQLKETLEWRQKLSDSDKQLYTQFSNNQTVRPRLEPDVFDNRKENSNANH